MRTKLLILLFAIPFFVTAQTGPGGIGKDDGTSGLKVWLRDTLKYVDAGVTLATSGDKIQQWNDVSGNNLHAIQTASSNQPHFASNMFNGFEAADFNVDNLTVNIDISPSKLPAISVIAVVNHNSATTNRSKVFGHDDGGFDRVVGFDERCGGATFDYFTGSGVACFDSPTANTPFVFTASYTPTEFFGWMNGEEKIVSATVSNGDGHAELTVGNINSSNSEYWDGAIAEFILYKDILNPIQDIIIHNYLAAKYDISMADNDIYDEDDAANGDYDYDVAGIGKLTDTNVHTDSRGTGIVEINNPKNLDNNEFLIWGHNNRPLAKTQEGDQDGSDYPPEVKGRWQRVWRVSERSVDLIPVDVGEIDISFDMTGQGPVVASDLALLVDTDNDNLFIDETPIGGAIDLGDNIYQFKGVFQIADNLRFTLGSTNLGSTPLPVELTAFEVKATDKNVLINWATASETQNDYFTVERSHYGKHWQAITTVAAAGNSSVSINYQALDEKPIKGISYYRLKQTDLTGDYTFSAVKSVKFDEKSTKLTIYPNPANNQISLRGNYEKTKAVQLFNALGQEVTNLTKTLSQNSSEIVLEVSQLSSGWYLLKSDNGIGNFYKK